MAKRRRLEFLFNISVVQNCEIWLNVFKMLEAKGSMRCSRIMLMFLALYCFSYSPCLFFWPGYIVHKNVLLPLAQFSLIDLTHAFCWGKSYLICFVLFKSE